MPKLTLIPQKDAPFRPWADRLVALLFVAAATTFIVLLALLRPDARGFGTHEQLGMAPCSWPPGNGLPCPTCGATTAATYVVQLNPLQALHTHPFGAVLAMFCLFLAGVASICLLRNRSFMAFLVLFPFGRVVASGIALLFLSWGYKYLTYTPAS